MYVHNVHIVRCTTTTYTILDTHNVINVFIILKELFIDVRAMVDISVCVQVFFCVGVTEKGFRFFFLFELAYKEVTTFILMLLCPPHVGTSCRQEFIFFLTYILYRKEHQKEKILAQLTCAYIITLNNMYLMVMVDCRRWVWERIFSYSFINLFKSMLFIFVYNNLKISLHQSFIYVVDCYIVRCGGVSSSRRSMRILRACVGENRQWFY